MHDCIFKCELLTDIEKETVPLMELSSLAENIHIKIREASQNTDLEMRGLLVINKALLSIQGNLANNTSKLTELDKQIKKDSKKLKEVEDDPTYSEVQRQIYRETGKISEHRLQGPNKSLKKFLIKMNVGGANLYFVLSMSKA